MREYRGKRVDNGEWVVGDLIHERYGVCIQYIVKKYPSGNGAPERQPIEERHKVTVIPESVGQHIGLPDKNGKKIYEGDCLGDIWKFGFIKYCEKCKQFQLHWMDENKTCTACDGDVHWFELVEDDGKLEVIGNIYENSELLK